MSKREKLLLRFRNNPKFVRFEEIDSLLLRLGFVKIQLPELSEFGVQNYTPRGKLKIYESLGFEKRQTGSHATYTFG